MIQTEIITCKNGIQQQHTWSDTNHVLIQVETGAKYSEAYDNLPCQYTYIESEELIDVINND
jgi:hypothetical protein